mgnify:FL=1
MATVYVPPEFGCLFILPIVTFIVMIRQMQFNLSTCIATYLILQVTLASLARYLYE